MFFSINLDVAPIEQKKPFVKFGKNYIIIWVIYV